MYEITELSVPVYSTWALPVWDAQSLDTAIHWQCIGHMTIIKPESGRTHLEKGDKSRSCHLQCLTLTKFTYAVKKNTFVHCVCFALENWRLKTADKLRWLIILIIIWILIIMPLLTKTAQLLVWPLLKNFPALAFIAKRERIRYNRVIKQISWFSDK